MAMILGQKYATSMTHLDLMDLGNTFYTPDEYPLFENILDFHPPLCFTAARSRQVVYLTGEMPKAKAAEGATV